MADQDDPAVVAASDDQLLLDEHWMGRAVDVAETVLAGQSLGSTRPVVPWVGL